MARFTVLAKKKSPPPAGRAEVRGCFQLQKYEEKFNPQNFSLRDPENTAERKKEAVWKQKGNAC